MFSLAKQVFKVFSVFIRHVHRVRDAMMHLNQARRDAEWGEEALELMVHICLNPDKKIFGGEVFESSEEGSRYRCDSVDLRYKSPLRNSDI